ncbi:bis(5'-nucleosyl)-tetraphosphatase [asymmetrical]-like isoform X2 [Sitodiplosis mosellana]|uniref:bis(5'-nucleosyl)-tetraphosphatase [asymmetrical]-like isoform X2 n=1 Tax=Sitodiplosis mosellana TaxID=263140 RepID=UPI00244382BE|nr:bis(5'-nucleosyl)-tetraphosphatase [asymmetrical]-like isoform X2 [Sitodiplosis mosellana]
MGVMSKGSKKVAGLVIFRRINDRIEYLMLKPNSQNKEWSPPKGRIDDGEDFLMAAIRETSEETGYMADDLSIYDAQHQMNQFTRKKGKDKTVVFWLAQLKDVTKQPKLNSDEHSKYRWLTKEEALQKCKMPEFAELVNEFDQIAQTL